MLGAKFALAAVVILCVFNGIASDRALKIGSAIGAATLGYGIHLSPLAMILGANTIRVGHSHPHHHHHKTLVHVHDHGYHYGGYGHGW